MWLDRVLCCYHDMEALVRFLVERARRLYGLVYPPDTWWMKAALAVKNVGFRLQRNPFRLYVHPTDIVDAQIRRHGFEQCYYKRTMLWQVVVYRRRHGEQSLTQVLASGHRIGHSERQSEFARNVSGERSRRSYT